MRILLLGLTLIGSGLAGGCASTSAHRSFLVERDWVHSTLSDSRKGYSATPQMTPKLVGKLIYQGNSTDGLVAYALDGRQVWRLEVPGGVNSGIEEKDGVLYFGGSDGQAYAVDALTGAVRWVFPTRAENLATPRLSEGTLFLLSGNNVIYALDPVSGRQKWLYDRAVSISDLSIRGGTQPAVANGTVYVGFTDGYLVALSARDGSVRWERLLNSNPKFRDVDSSPLIIDNQIYVASFDHALYALGLDDGQVLWRFEDGGASPPTAIDDTLYSASSSGWMRALNRKSGKVIWEKKLKKGIASQPQLLKGILVFAESHGNLLFWDARTGESIGQYELGWGSLASPTVSPGTDQVFSVSNASNLHVVQARWRSGKPLSWKKE